MKLNPIDGYLIRNYIIWGELDYRGWIALGIKAENDFIDLSFLSDLEAHCQYIRSENQDYLFVSYPLELFTPPGSIFNLSNDKLNDFYKSTSESSQNQLQKTFLRIKSLCKQNIEVLNKNELAKLWYKHFNPLAQISELAEFNPLDSILTNCLPGYKVHSKAVGFELNNCLHHFLEVKTCVSLSKVSQILKNYSFSISLYKGQYEFLIHLFGTNTRAISEESFQLKELLHALPGTDYYETNEVGENVRFFENSIPAYAFVKGAAL